MKNKAIEKLVTKSLSKGKYKHPEACKHDVLTALRVYKGLAPQFEKFVFDNGDEQMLLNINGTIPIDYKGSTYNIPVCFWFLCDHPLSAPMTFVKPTQDMMIKASHNVSFDGRVSLPYLDNWKHPDSKLLDFIELCTTVFGQNPPVFSKPKTHRVSPPIPHQFSFSSLSSERTSTEVLSRQASLQDQELLNGRSNSNGFQINSEDNISDAHLRLSLVTAVEDRVRARLKEETMKTKAELQALQSTNQELSDGQEKLCGLIKDLDIKNTEIDAYNRSLEEATEDMQGELSQLEHLEQNPVHVDEIIVVPNPLHERLLNASAMDSALDDAIYTLGMALHQGVIECDVYIRKVRNLSRKQFEQRVIMQKCSQLVDKK